MRTSVIVAAVSLLGLTAVTGICAKRPWMRGVVPVAAAAPRVPVVVRAEGRVVARPGAQVALSAETGGTIARVLVREGARVKKGDVLLELKHAEQSAALQEAWAMAGEANARLRARTRDARLTQELAASGSVAKHELEGAAEERTAARARLAAAQASAWRSKAAVDRTRTVAPIDGVVIFRGVEEGETVAPGAPLFTIVDLTRLRVEAEVDELDLGRVGLGSEVQIAAEAFGGQAWSGTIDEVPSALVPRRLRSQDPARPSDSNVLLAKLALPEGTPLKLGQRVSLRIGPPK